MNLELLKTTRGARGRARHNTAACAAVAIAMAVGCGSEAASTDPEGAAGATSTTPASTGAAGGAATTPATPTSTAPTKSATTTTGTTAAPTTTQPVTGVGTTPSAGTSTPTTPATPTTTTPSSPAAGAAGGGAAAAAAAGAGAAMMPGGEIELPVETGTPTLFWLDITGNTIYTAGADGSGQKRFASGAPLSAPDGVAVDPTGGFLYVLNMGTVIGGGNSGSLVRYKLDGTSPETIMPAGSKADGETFNTGKQVSMDKVNRKLYLGDREGSKVWRCDMDGKNLEVLVSGHMIQQIVGVAPDPIKKQFYFSDRNGKKLFRANMEMPAGKTHADRDDLEMLYAEKAANAMPLDIELDVKGRVMYWTDRSQGKVFSMPMDMPAGMDGNTRTDVKTVASGLPEAIGLGFDHENGQLFVTHSASVSTVKTDGTGLKQIGTGGTGTGIAFTHIP